MRIAFDSMPLISEVITGIGYCESGQIKSLINLHPEDEFLLQYFYIRNIEEKELRLLPYKKKNVKLVSKFFSSKIYRAAINFIPLSYNMFFGKNADVTHFFNYIVPPLVKTATVVTVHDMVYKSYPETMNARTRKMFDLSLKRSMKKATLIVTDSEFSKQEMIKYYPEFSQKVRVVPCGVDLKKFNPEIDKAEIAKVKINFGIHGDYFLYLGTLEPRKNLVRLIEAYDMFSKKMTSQGKKVPYLVIAGNKGWQFEEIFNKVKELNISDLVIFTSYIPDNDLSPLIHGALSFVFPSIYEGFGLPPLEAMACGVPVIVSNSASLPEVVGDSGLICDAFDVKSISESLEKIYTDDNFRSKLVKKGLERVKNFTWDMSAKKLYDVYKEAEIIYNNK